VRTRLKLAVLSPKRNERFEFMQCLNCQAEISKKLLFCDSCGTKVEQQEIPELVAPREKTFSQLSEHPSQELTLRVWKPLRWLVSADYGHIKLVEDHLVIKTFTTLTRRGFKIFFQLFCYGFDIASILRFESTNQLRNLSTISVFKPTWIKWKVPFVVVRSPGFIGVFGVATETLDAVQAFVQATREATASVKYNVK
jgi:hypothetical protein